MTNGRDPKGSSRAKSPLAVTLALTATFLGAPALYGLTEPYVTPILERNYGYGFTELYRVGWSCMTAALVFFPALAIIEFALMVLMSGLLFRLI